MTMTVATAQAHLDDALDKLDKARAGDYSLPGFSVSRSIRDLTRQVAYWERRVAELSSGAARNPQTSTVRFT